MSELATALDEVILPSDTKSPIFIGGQRRSGTSLLRVLLNRHERIAAGPESKFVQDPSFMAWHDQIATAWATWLEGYEFGRTEVDRAVAALVDNLFTRYQLREGKARWAEKTPTNILRIDYLFRLFPHAQFIHVIRDPRDAYCSIRKRAQNDKPEWAKFRPRRAARDWC
ncbi:MAG TPA: sulfotransferase, partial [Chloroflexota bacterium]